MDVRGDIVIRTLFTVTHMRAWSMGEGGGGTCKLSNASKCSGEKWCINRDTELQPDQTDR